MLTDVIASAISGDLKKGDQRQIARATRAQNATTTTVRLPTERDDGRRLRLAVKFVSNPAVGAGSDAAATSLPPMSAMCAAIAVPRHARP
jgi:hypothetical protein